MFTLFPSYLFSNNITAIFFSILFIVVLIVELSILKRKHKTKEDKSSMPLIILGLFIPLIIMFYTSYKGFGIFPLRTTYLGIVILILGFALRQLSIYILGKSFTPAITVSKKQKVIESGPYMYIRHPSYAGLILELLGVALSLSSWIGFLVSLLFLIPVMIYRINIEEKLLAKNLSNYKDYTKRTYRLIPFIY